MSALLIVRNGSEVVGRCDALCYDAKHEACVCICGGRCHRLGLDRALEAVRQLVDEHRGAEIYELTAAALQEALFPLKDAA